MGMAPLDADRVRGSLGLPVSSIELRLVGVDEREVAPGETARMDEKGYLHFMDRKRDTMRQRGINISSLQLEQAIVAHPGIGSVAVRAVPSPLGEDDIKACIVAEPAATLHSRANWHPMARERPALASTILIQSTGRLIILEL